MYIYIHDSSGCGLPDGEKCQNDTSENNNRPSMEIMTFYFLFYDFLQRNNDFFLCKNPQFCL